MADHRRTRTTHGRSKSPIYQVWVAMRHRCLSPKCVAYPNYGGRGIRILWKNFEEFEQDMLPSFLASLTIERKDNNGHYCKENCRWATHMEQARNRRNTAMATILGVTMSVPDWAERLGIKAGTIYRRIRNGMHPDADVMIPISWNKSHAKT